MNENIDLRKILKDCPKGWPLYYDREFLYKFYVSRARFSECVPFNDDTKHLVGTTDEAPEFYRYWED